MHVSPGMTRRVGRPMLFVALGLACILYLWKTEHFTFTATRTIVSGDDYSPPDYSSPNYSSPNYSPFYGGGSTRPIDISSDPLPNATLSERLDAWERAPAPASAEYARWNAEQCDTNIHNQQNWYLLNTYGGEWATHDMSTVIRIRTELINYMRTVDGGYEMNSATNLHGHGIVMLAGDGASLMRVYWSVSMIRSYRCNLPIYVYHFEDEKPALDNPLRLKLEALNVILVTVEGSQKAKTGKNYHLKAHAIIRAPFQHVLYLDSDSIPVRDPKYMFTAPNYLRLGVYFTPDYFKTSATNPLWAVAGIKCRNEWEVESGQFFIDKARHMDVLLLSRYMLSRHEQYFKYSDGDKDIFRWALLMLRKRWAVPGRYVAAGSFPQDVETGYCGHTMIQHDSYGAPFTIHWNLLKQHYPAFTALGTTWGRSKQLPMFNTWPATPATARLNEPVDKPNDTDRRGLGDIDCDMLADADEAGHARAPAKEMIMRRAVREQGVNSFWHGGNGSPFCLGLDYSDIRPQSRKAQDAADRRAGDTVGSETKGVWPDWSNPFEIVSWADDPHLNNFENTLYTRFQFDVRYEP
ncbi:hypothetical protein CcaverHIS002_0705910 [Cutaneotrichosporon cavernicola]|nr:hypothetical protein CcaverHIS002_0705910 [Cutaneotrichosporon cavernicola]BEJ02788.1 hypothetical protein CcaverHIS631_0705830 [Cutaneotrichosporon cavernicola]BEJ10541.1 hypothetical protein CcaverHIS641_0705760 [Cutaneotrichosporon cavernicola]